MARPLFNSMSVEAQPPLISFQQYSPIFGSTKPPLLVALPIPSPSPSPPPPPFTSRHPLSLSFKILSTFKSSPSTSTTSSQDAAALHGNHHILSTTECTDGSVVFRFGDASEVARIAQTSTRDVTSNDPEHKIDDKEISVIDEEDDKVDSNEAQRTSNSNEVVGSVKEVAIQTENSSEHKVGMCEGSVNSNVANMRSKDDAYSVSELEIDVDASREGSVETISHEFLMPARIQSELNDVVEGETTGDNSEVNPLVIDSGPSTIPAEEVVDKESEDKITPQPASSVTNEVVDDIASQEGSSGNFVVDVLQLTTDNEIHDVHSKTKHIVDGIENKDIAVAMVRESTELVEENILDEKPIHDLREVGVNAEESESLEDLEGGVRTAAVGATSSSEDLILNQPASSAADSATEVVNDVVSLGASNADNLVEPIHLNADDEESESDMPTPATVESQTSKANMNRVEISKSGLYLSSEAAILPHPSKALTGAEDAYFIDDNWMGIADGIGDWSLEGTRAGKYSSELVKCCEKIVSDSKGILMLDPVEVLNRIAAETQSPGASTALISHFDGQILHVANLGDSGFIILRHGTVCEQSSPMLHEFYFPLRIESGDDPSELVEVYKTDLDEGDIIITGTNGLFHNLYEQEIASIVSKSLQAGLKLEEIAAKLAARAREVGESACARSPFADAAQAAGYAGHTGGKLDNVTVIVSIVQNTNTL